MKPDKDEAREFDGDGVRGLRQGKGDWRVKEDVSTTRGQWRQVLDLGPST